MIIINTYIHISKYILFSDYWQGLVLNEILWRKNKLFMSDIIVTYSILVKNC
jgi:hypothetical protein